ncbi:MAG: amidohydrolase family protein [Candidatus Omnitrophica bacterium]|nr:amidohydrolase family protein [Candidatus Omnitrophota bacterium]
MIIDCHSHWLPEQIITNAHFYSQSWGNIENQLKMMDETGIDKAVLTYPTSDAHLKLGGLKELSRIYNDNVSEILKRYPDRFIGAAILPVGKASDIIDELIRAIDELGFTAVSLATSYDGLYLDDPMFEKVYKNAQDYNIPIFIHPQIVNPIGYDRVQDPLLTPVVEYIFDTAICIGKLMMSGVLMEYSDVHFIFSNFGGGICSLFNRFDATYEMLRGINFVKDLKIPPSALLKNIYVETSGDTLPANFQVALEALGASHIFWGSDWPAKQNVRESIQVVRELPLGIADKENILGNNLADFLTLQR